MTAEQVRRNKVVVAIYPLLGVCIAVSCEVFATGGVLLDDASLDKITAGRAEQNVSAVASAGGNNPVAGTRTAANAVSIESPLNGGTASASAGTGAAVACCNSSNTGVSGSVSVPGSRGTSVGRVQTLETSGLSISVGGFGGAGVQP